jgi:hypothetical protein
MKVVKLRPSQTRVRINLRRSLIALVASVLGIGGLAFASAPNAQATNHSLMGCPSQYACLYNGPALNTPIITSYYYYGYYNLSNILGEKALMNNQTNYAWTWACRGYYGRQCEWGTRASDDAPSTVWGAIYRDFTPVNSIRLTP